MSKILFIGDPHLKITKFNLSKSFLDWVSCLIKEISPDLVVNLGDTMDTHAILRSELMCEFKKHIHKVIEVCPYFYVLGNHDMHKANDSTYHALQSFSHISNFTVIEKPTIVGDITFVPYIHNFEEFPEISTPICVAHQTFVGCDYGYYRPDVGVDAGKISTEIIISGHIHKRQMFGNVIYPGTPYAQGLDDIDQSKGVMLFDTETYKYEFIESPLPKWRGMKLEVSQEYSISNVHSIILSNLTEIDNWILDITGPRAELTAYIDSNNFILLKKKYNIRVRTNFTDKLKHQVKISSSSMEDIVFEYIDKVYGGALSKDLLKDKLLEILTNSDKK